ncbi:MAG: aminoacetone oxidase family FAD-binding enzyme [Lentisphaeria bacterium]|nr:aminoacetone oxidase family FAD-binding enzyme [Lentisphaeria bacterium]
MEKPIIIIGSGPAGLAARTGAGEMGKKAVILEKADRPSLKLLASGGTKCNFSNMLSKEDFMARFGRKGSFMRNALTLTFREWVSDFLSVHGIKTVLTDDFYCFPASGGAKAVRDAFCEGFDKVETFAEVTEILTENGQAAGVLLKDGRKIESNKVILAAGTSAWASLGSKKGLLLAEKCGHTIVDILPAVAPLHIKEEWVKSLAGVSLEKAEILLYEEKSSAGGKKKVKEIWKTRGNLLFTHEGLSGFSALDMAEEAGKMCLKNTSATILLKVFPERSREETAMLPALYRKEYGNKLVRSLLAEREKLPRSLAENIARLAECEEMTGCRLTAESEKNLISLLCDGIPLTVEKTGPMEKAMAASGGVSLKEIDPATMESKLIKGLYFAGEIMDLVGPCGGYNIQWAISSGRLAGRSAAMDQK